MIPIKMHRVIFACWIAFATFAVTVNGFNISQQALMEQNYGQKRVPPWAYKNGQSYEALADAAFEISTHGLSQTERDFLWDQVKKCEINPPPAPGTFVKVKGTQFTYNNKPFYFLGMNSYHLVREELEQNSWNVDYTFRKAKDLGFQVIRLWAFSDNLRQDLYTWDQDTFKALDSILDKAKQYNLKVVLAFINYWEEFNGTDSYVQMVHGTIKDYTIDEFYSNQDIKLAYKSHVCKVINRVNFFSGVKYRDDPTIMAWNLINEPRCPECAGQSHHGGKVGGLVAEWIDEMAAFVKSIDPNHLLTTGAEGFFGRTSTQNVVGLNPAGWSVCTGTDFNLMHRGPNIDYAVMHVYVEHKSVDFDQDVSCDMDCKINWVTRYVQEHFEEAKNNLNKPIVIEEFGLSLLENFTNPEGRTRNYNRLDRVAIFRRILGLFAANMLQGGAGVGAMVWTAAVNNYADYDGRTVYLDDEAATPQFESKNIVEWEKIPLLDSFQKIDVQLHCTLSEYGGIWKPTPLNDSSQIEVEDILGQNELDLFRSTRQLIEDAGMLATFRKSSRVPEQFNIDQQGVLEGFSRSIIDDELFEQFYSEFLPDKLSLDTTSSSIPLSPPLPPPSPLQSLNQSLLQFPFEIPPSPEEKTSLSPSTEEKTPLSPTIKQVTLETPQIESPPKNNSDQLPPILDTLVPPMQFPPPPLPPPPTPITKFSPPPPSPAQSPPPLPPPPSPVQSPPPSPPPPIVLFSPPPALSPSPLPLPSTPLPPPLPAPLNSTYDEVYEIAPSDLVSTIQSLLPTYYDTNLSPSLVAIEENNNSSLNNTALPGSVVNAFGSSIYNYYEDDITEYYNVLDVYLPQQPPQLDDILSPPAPLIQEPPPLSPYNSNVPSISPHSDDYSPYNDQYPYDQEYNLVSSPGSQQNDTKKLDAPVVEDQNVVEDPQQSAGASYSYTSDNQNFNKFSELEQATYVQQGQCQWRKNINFKGQVLKTLQADGIEGCCQACQDHPRCNVFVHCPKSYGCHNDGQILPYNLCDLKFQQTVVEGQYPQVWTEGPSTHLSSGYISYKGQA